MKLKPNQNVIQHPPCQRAGMTLIEVVIALAIAGLMIGGIVSGYIFCENSTQKSEYAQVAIAKAMERLEETRSAPWNVIYPLNDQLVATNFPDQNVSLDVTAFGLGTMPATVTTTISQIPATPPMTSPLRRIRVDCIWQYKGVEWITNTIETIRAPDQ